MFRIFLYDIMLVYTGHSIFVLHIIACARAEDVDGIPRAITARCSTAQTGSREKVYLHATTRPPPSQKKKTTLTILLSV